MKGSELAIDLQVALNKFGKVRDKRVCMNPVRYFGIVGTRHDHYDIGVLFAALARIGAASSRENLRFSAGWLR